MFIILKIIKSINGKISIMKHYFVLLMLLVSLVHTKQSTMSNCKPDSQLFKFWDCKGTVATFDPKVHQEVSLHFYNVEKRHNLG